MKIYRATEKQIDERLALDKRRDSSAFCRGFDTEAELPLGFCDLQDKIRDGLEAEFWVKFDDGKDRSNLRPYQLAGAQDFFFFPAELIMSERILIEMSHEILGDKLLGLIMAYLEKCPSRYCVILAVCRGEIIGSNYVGRFVINQDEIAVKESLCETWSKQVKIMEIEG